jgi:hypothetical protein
MQLTDLNKNQMHTIHNGSKELLKTSYTHSFFRVITRALVRRRVVHASNTVSSVRSIVFGVRQAVIFSGVAIVQQSAVAKLALASPPIANAILTCAKNVAFVRTLPTSPFPIKVAATTALECVVTLIFS